ncbi:hypothetical protein PFUGPA_00001, partial [Plasmodium falciparum Palo Alto/Uganda]
WANKVTPQAGGVETTEAGSQETSETSSQIDGKTTSESSDKDPQVALLKAFVKSAAVETFFLWDRYKKIKEKEKQEKKDAKGQIYESGGKDEANKNKDPQNQLKKGIIPEEFKRQMFYTLGDYRDICVGVKDDVAEALKASGDNKSGDKNIKDISEKIKEMLGKQPGPPVTKNSVDPRKTWWNENGKKIWEGMLCALTYDTNSGGEGKSPTQDPAVRAQLWDNTKNTLKDTYTYETVTFKGGFDDTDTSAAKKSDDSPTTTTILSKFVQRPTFFRWLEEWGEEFCHKQKHKLYIIKKECKVDKGDDGRCSGDGFKCTQIVENENGTITGLDCPGCAKYCGFYKKWIKKKKDEFIKQKDRYQTEIRDVHNNNDNGFSTTIKAYTDATKFLEKLEGPCKSNNENDDDDDSEEDNEINFQESTTFEHTQKCDPCSKFKINCKENGKCKNGGGGTNHKCNGKTPIDATDIEKKTDGNGNIHMRVSDNNTNGNKFDDLNDCDGADIFKGIRKEQWKCGKVCGLDVCGLKSDNGENKDQIITIRGLVAHWVQNFLEDYNKIRKKLKTCMNSEVSKSENNCEKKHKCVNEWIEKKRTEWTKIKEYYQKQYGGNDSDNSYSVRTFLEEVIPQITDANDKKQIIKLSKFDNSCGCSFSAHSTNGKDDAIDCMIKNLEKKIEECKKKHAQNGGDQTKQTCENSHPEPEEPLEEEENPENIVENMRPNICPPPEKEEVKEESGCEPENEKKKEKEKEEQEEPASEGGGTEGKTPTPSSVETDKEKPKTQEEKLPKPPKPTPPTVLDHPAVIPSLVTSTLAWSVGIGFAAKK